MNMCIHAQYTLRSREENESVLESRNQPNNSYSYLVSRRVQSLRGRVTVGPDKSISHRALMFSALAVGTTRISNILTGDDVLATAQALCDLGVAINIDRNSGSAQVEGVGVHGLRSASKVLDFGNSGTSARLFMGILSGVAGNSMVTGDLSLRKRPMARVVLPLLDMGATFSTTNMGSAHPIDNHITLANASSIDPKCMTLPMVIHGRNPLLPITYTCKVASAQVKSAILLAGLYAVGTTTVIEPVATRDHTERMLKSFGVDVMIQRDHVSGHTAIAVEGGSRLTACDIAVPGDISSAAFVIVAATITSKSDVIIDNVGCNPLRTGIVTALLSMGADITWQNQRTINGEPVGDIHVRSAQLRGIDVPQELVPLMIDEFPILAVAAAMAQGVTSFRGVAELRHKESDRLQAVYDGLVAFGVRCEIGSDWLTIHGMGKVSDTPDDLPLLRGEVLIKSHLDHRIAMAFCILGLLTQNGACVDDAHAVQTSFPTFNSIMNQLGADISPATQNPFTEKPLNA